MKFRTTIRNCPVTFEFQCPKDWDQLDATNVPNVRHCTQCNENVFFCESDDETLARAKNGQCVARRMPEWPEGTPIMIGRPTHPPELVELENLSEKERAVDEALQYLDTATRFCPHCRWPLLPDQWHCFVCDKETGRE